MKKYLDYILLGCSALLLVLMLVLLVAPGLTATILGHTESVALSEFVSGDRALGGTGAAVAFAVLALAAALCLLVFKVMGKELPFAPYIAFGAALFALLAAIMFFCTVEFDFAASAKELGCSVADIKALDDGTTKLGAGAIVNGLFGLLAAGALGCLGAFKLKK